MALTPSGFGVEIEDLDLSSLTEEDRSLLRESFHDPDFVYMHRWAEGDVIIWDNRSTLHAPTPFDGEHHQRLLYRITVTGPQIVGF